MTRKLLGLIITAALFWIAVETVFREQPPGSVQVQTSPPVSKPVPGFTASPQIESPPGRVADISVHTEQELTVLFDRVEQLLDRPRSGAEEALFTLVLHGPEVEFFALKNYDKYKGVVDRAAKLAALGAVDFSICQTQMRNLGIGTDEVPSFLRQVPFGPDEVKRLIESGYVYM